MSLERRAVLNGLEGDSSWRNKLEMDDEISFFKRGYRFRYVEGTGFDIAVSTYQ